MAISRSWAKNPRNFEIISRQDAFVQGRTIYYDGPDKPCKHGHIAPRYVANSGCLACLTRHAAARAYNLHSHDLVPYIAATPWWRSRRLSAEQLAQLDKYVQTAIDTFCAHVLPPLCKTCNGERWVFVQGASPPRKEVCPACEDHVPSTADVGAG